MFSSDTSILSPNQDSETTKPCVPRLKRLKVRSTLHALKHSSFEVDSVSVADRDVSVQQL